MLKLQNKGVKERLHEVLPQGKEEKNKRIQAQMQRLQKYCELLSDVSKLAYENAAQMVDGDGLEQITGGTPIASLSGGASVNATMATLGGGMAADSSTLVNLTGLAGLSTLSDKEQVVIYKKAFETAMTLLMQSDKSRMSRKKSRRKAAMERKGKKRMIRTRTGKRSSRSSRIP